MIPDFNLFFKSHTKNTLIKNFETLNMDAFSDGQIQSKLWLATELEKIHCKTHSPSSLTVPAHLFIIGSWYGMLALILTLRQKIPILSISLYDQDPKACKIAKKVLDFVRFIGIDLKIICIDCRLPEFKSQLDNRRNTLSLAEKADKNNPAQEIYINTSCEHFTDFSWLDNLPRSSFLALQSTDMRHIEHVSSCKSIEELIIQSELNQSQIYFADTKKFDYGQLCFNRFMLIGKRT